MCVNKIIFPDQPAEYVGYYEMDVTVGKASRYPTYEATHVTLSAGVPSPLTEGYPACAGDPTPSVGVGAVNVRLEWEAYADLDLWVVDPGGEKIYFDNSSSASGGALDMDNKCSNFQMGRPENIFWAANPPTGIYKVYVDYYRDCGAGFKSIDQKSKSDKPCSACMQKSLAYVNSGPTGPVRYKVTWTLKGQTYSKSGTISPPASSGADGDEVLVTDFSY